MQNVVIAKPYRFVAPHRSKLWCYLFRPILGLYLRKSHGVITVACRGVERLRAALDAGHGIMLAPNHCRPPDPMVLGHFSSAIDRPLYVIASWHLFMQNALQRTSANPL